MRFVAIVEVHVSEIPFPSQLDSQTHARQPQPNTDDFVILDVDLQCTSISVSHQGVRGKENEKCDLIY